MGETEAQHEDLLRSLYAEYRQPLLHYVLRKVGGDYQAAEDIVQETLLRAWQNAGRLQAEQAGGWLYTVAHNLVVSRYRRRQRGPGGEVPIDPAVQLPAPNDDLDRALESWQMIEAMRGLSLPHREVLIELYYRRRTVNEAAAELGIPPGTVKSRSFYALQALRATLDQKGVTTP